ncbi:hypothetical protein JNK13_07610 [bacterium]|nr:hypothetical protein [bacterium]
MKKALCLLTALIFFACSANHSTREPSGHVISDPATTIKSTSPYVLYLEPLILKGAVRLEGNKKSSTYNTTKLLGIEEHYQPRDYLYQQFLSTLAESTELSLVDKRFVKKSSVGGINVKMRSGEKGPYIIRAMITEFNPAAIVEDFSVGGANVNDPISLLLSAPLFMASSMIEGHTGIPVPTKYSSSKIEAAVAIDITLIDGKSGRVIKSLPVRGTYTEAKREIERRAETMVGSSASSTLPAAVRVALESARDEIIAALKNYH